MITFLISVNVFVFFIIALVRTYPFEVLQFLEEIERKLNELENQND